MDRTTLQYRPDDYALYFAARQARARAVGDLMARALVWLADGARRAGGSPVMPRAHAARHPA